ncbi:MAG TPA: L-histidine N(alpha)-methyltransferase [Myxococcota bacterium]|nr:L-histidine N(alpha)-methyltransferase [Myxococcota bacterium]
MTSADPSSRYTLLESDPHAQRASFADAVAQGLGSEPKSLPCRFFYDEAGSLLFEEICRLPEYYLTRAEREILEAHADEIVVDTGSCRELVELGSGSASKTRLLIEAFLRRAGRLRYVPIDISRSALAESAQALLAEYPDLEIRAIAGEYEQGLLRLRAGSDAEPRLFAWLGSNIGNFDRAEAADFLRHVREAMRARDRLLVGIDLRKDRRTLERAYDDASGVTARFNRNLLARINRELGARFDLEHFRHEAVWRSREGRVELSLVSRRDQEVPIPALDVVVKLRKGERIHTEDSFKYSPREIAEVAEAAELRVLARWCDGASRFSLNLLAPAADRVAD